MRASALRARGSEPWARAPFSPVGLLEELGPAQLVEIVDVDGKDYRIVGVLKKWSPQPRFYDVVNTGGFTTSADDLFIPFLRAIDVSMTNDGNTNCSESPTQSGFKGLQQSS